MMQIDPLTKKKLKRFRSIKRSYYSFIVLTALVLLSSIAEVFVNNKALMVSYDGNWYFPTYTHVVTGRTLGQDYDYEANYRELREQFKVQDEGNWVLMPVVPWDPYEQDFDGVNYPPTAPSFDQQHYLGTDQSGRDVLARLIYGFRIAIWFAMLTLAISYTIGVLVGSLMGYLGGRFDLVMQRVIEVWSMVPFLYVIMIMVSIIQPSFFLFVFINVLFGWISITWYMRTMTYKEKAREYVTAARAQGAGMFRVIIKHILPNTMVMIVTLAPFGIVANITTLTALDYLGLGLMPPTPSWGDLLQQGKSNLDAYWIISSVVFAIVSVLTMVTFIGEGVREAFDPKKFTRYI
ncbi:ABC transporter permease subunit [Vibrio kagoshimensis]